MDWSWQSRLEKEWNKPYWKELEEFIRMERSQYVVFPPEELVFSAFKETPFDQVKVVIVGQDPYHGLGQAQGLSFSVPEGTPLPRSLKNIFTELQDDLHIPLSKTGCLIPWARQGVFLLNATLTVRSGEPKSHYGKGWEIFTDAVIDALLTRTDPIIFLLWGKSAQKKGLRVESSSVHKVLMAAHPSPYSVSGFKKCRHFSRTNQYLLDYGDKPICWDLSFSEKLNRSQIGKDNLKS